MKNFVHLSKFFYFIFLQDGFCQIENMTVTYPIKGFTDVTPFSVEALKVNYRTVLNVINV